MPWHPLPFGKHKGKTLPQVVFSNPDWFFWACENNWFDGRPVLRHEAKIVFDTATSIPVPQEAGKERRVVEYNIGPDGKCWGFDLVPASSPRHEGTTTTARRESIDLSYPRRLKNYDKLSYHIFLRSLKFHLFGSETKRMTRQACEKFFEDLGADPDEDCYD
jgi:hypothetical protein